MKNRQNRWSRLYCLGISILFLIGSAINYSNAQCNYTPGETARFANNGYDTNNTQVCYLVDITGAIVASDPSGNCDFPGVVFGVYEVYALNDCPAGNSDITAIPPTTLTELTDYAANDDVDIAGPVPFTVCNPSQFNVCEGAQLTVSSMPDYDMNNSQIYILVCDGEVVEIIDTAPTAVFTAPVNPGVGVPVCEVHVLNYCDAAESTIGGIAVGEPWVDPTVNNSDIAKISVSPLLEDCINLPLELVSFEGECEEGQSTTLSWSTLSEEGVLRFIIERSFNGIDGFIQIGSVEAQGNSNNQQNYTYLDERPIGKGYYRLVVLDEDGSLTNSNLILIECLTNGFGITTIYPNPTDDKVTITYETTDRGPINFQLIDVLGRVLMAEELIPELGINTKEVDFKFLASAVYFITMENGNKRIVEKVIKRN